MEITKKDFSIISWIIILALFLMIIFATFSADKVFIGDSTFAIVGPVILIFGVILFFLNSLRYVRSKSYLLNNLRIRNIGASMGLFWFFLMEIGVVLYLGFGYTGVCEPFSIWSQSHYPCSLFSYLFFIGGDFTTGIVMIFSLWLLLVPVIMYIFGFFIDRYTAKKIGESQAH